MYRNFRIDLLRINRSFLVKAILEAEKNGLVSETILNFTTLLGNSADDK